MIDWESVQAGSLTESRDGTSTLAIAQVIENVGRDLELENQDAAYGVAAVTRPQANAPDSTGKKIMIGALGGMLAAFGESKLGM